MPRRKVKAHIDKEPVALAETLEAVAERHSLTPASEVLRPLDPPEVQETPDEPPDLGPRKRHPGEERAVFVGREKGFRLVQAPEYRGIRFADDHPPDAGEKAAMRDAGLSYDVRERIWRGPNSFAVREATDRLALDMAGKGEGCGR